MKLFKVISSSGELSRRKSIDAIKKSQVTEQLLLKPISVYLNENIWGRNSKCL